MKAISSHSENVKTYSPCIYVNDDTAGGGSHSHSGYAVDHEIDEVREECDNMFAALKSEWGMKLQQPTSDSLRSSSVPVRAIALIHFLGEPRRSGRVGDRAFTVNKAVDSPFCDCDCP